MTQSVRFDILGGPFGYIETLLLPLDHPRGPLGTEAQKTSRRSFVGLPFGNLLNPFGRPVCSLWAHFWQSACYFEYVFVFLFFSECFLEDLPDSIFAESGS